MRTPIALAAALAAVPFFSFGCAADEMAENDAPNMAEETETTATAEQAITASERQGIGMMYDTGVSMGFAEVFASLVNWSTPVPSTQTDWENMNGALSTAAYFLPGTHQAIPASTYNPPTPAPLSKYIYPIPLSKVKSVANDIDLAIYMNSTYTPYYKLGRNLAIAEEQAYLATIVGLSDSWQFACWALDSAQASADVLKDRVQIDRGALSTLRYSVCFSRPGDAYTQIKTLREQYASAVYTTAEFPPCGNGVCGSGETCSSCPSDCGSCPCPNNPGGQPNNYSFCIYCQDSYGNWTHYTRYETGCTYTDAATWVQNTTTTNCVIYANACP